MADIEGPTVQRVARIESVAWQAVAVLVAVAFLGVQHWSNDGLWFQGDAPRHAANGLFLWDYLTTLPADPLDFALRYYARYPIIAPLAYPPAFYVLEAVAFGLAGPSPFVAKGLVLAFAAIAGLYAMAWARRWGGDIAGWAGMCVVLLPGFVRYSHAVMLNVPATALMIGALYHLVVWLETDSKRHGRFFVIVASAALLTYYPAAVVLSVALAWIVLSGRWKRLRSVWLMIAIVLVLALVIAIALPQHWARHAPSVTRLVSSRLWTFYGLEILDLAGPVWAVAGALGLFIAIASARYRRRGIWTAIAFPVVVACLVMLPAESGRYAFVLGPLTVIGGFLGIASRSSEIHRSAANALVVRIVLVAVLSIAIYSGVTVEVPAVSGFQHAAAYLRDNAPADTVLYSGPHDGVFGFYVHAGDRRFQQRVVLAHKLLARYEQTPQFWWKETPLVTSADDVVALLRRQCGCRWVAVEVRLTNDSTVSERLLRLALWGPEFERVQSFPISGAPTVRLDLYRFLLPLDPAPPMDLTFPSFSGRVFPGIEPIPSRR